MKLGLQIASHKRKRIEYKNEIITLYFIFSRVCRHLHISESEAMKKNRNRPEVIARQMTIYIARKNLPDTLTKIGNFFGKKHDSALYAVKTIENLLETNREFREKNEKFINSFQVQKSQLD